MPKPRVTGKRKEPTLTSRIAGVALACRPIATTVAAPATNPSTRSSDQEEAMGLLDEKVVLITGTGGGLGRVAAQTFAREGAKVVGCDIKVDANNETVELIGRAGGEMTGIAPIDLTDPDQAQKMIEDAVAA